MTCCRTKRGCFAKSSLYTGTEATENAYGLDSVADSSSSSGGQGTVAAVNAGLASASGNGHTVNNQALYAGLS